MKKVILMLTRDTKIETWIDYDYNRQHISIENDGLDVDYTVRDGEALVKTDLISLVNEKIDRGQK